MLAAGLCEDHFVLICHILAYFAHFIKKQTFYFQGSLELIFNFYSHVLKKTLRTKCFSKQGCKNEIENNNIKICSRFSYTIFQNIHLTAYELHRDLPPARELNNQSRMV